MKGHTFWGGLLVTLLVGACSAPQPAKLPPTASARPITPAAAQEVAPDAFLRLALEVCPKVVTGGAQGISTYVVGFSGLMVQPLASVDPGNPLRRSFTALLSVPADASITQVVSRDPQKQRTTPLLSVSNESRRCVVMRAAGDASFAELRERFATEPGWSKVFNGTDGAGVWVRYDANDRPLFTLQAWFVVPDAGRTFYIMTLPLTPEQTRQVSLDDRPRVVDTLLSECLASVAGRRKPTRTKFAEFFEPPTDNAHGSATLKEKYGRAASLQLATRAGDTCLYSSGGGTLANRRLKELIEHNLAVRNATNESVPAGYGGQSWRIAAANSAIAARVTLELDASDELLVLHVRKASL